MENARWHHGASLRPLEFPLDDAPAIEALLSAYPVGRLRSVSRNVDEGRLLVWVRGYRGCGSSPCLF
jgi:hypothetical protein